MKRLLLMIIFVFVGIAAWRIGDSLSSDAVGLAVGVVFGVMAGLPTALLVLAGNRRRGEDREERHAREVPAPYGYGGQPPVIVLAGSGLQPQASLPEQNSHQLGAGERAPRPERQFRFVGAPEGSNLD